MATWRPPHARLASTDIAGPRGGSLLEAIALSIGQRARAASIDAGGPRPMSGPRTAIPAIWSGTAVPTVRAYMAGMSSA